MGLTNFSGQVGGKTHKIRVRSVEPTDPTPVAGDWYYDPVTGKMFVHDGSQWWASLVGTSTSTSSSSTSTTSTSTSSTSSSTSSTSSSTSISTSTSTSTTTIMYEGPIRLWWDNSPGPGKASYY